MGRPNRGEGLGVIVLLGLVVCMNFFVTVVDLAFWYVNKYFGFLFEEESY